MKASKQESISSAPGRATLRKARWRLIPLLAVCYGVAYIDRVNVSFASLQMNHDLHFSASVYGFGAGVFFISYAACEIPSNLMLIRFGARRWLSRIMISWGILAMLMIFVRTSTSFYSVRFLLGISEAGFFPGVMYYLTLWFPRETRARTVSYFYVALPLSGTVMGSLAGWLLGLSGRLGLAGWQWLFLVEGLPAVLLGGALFFILPDGPKDANWLTGEEREWLIGRMQGDRSTVNQPHGPLRSVLTDPRIWLLGVFELVGLMVLYAYSFTAPLMLQHSTALTPSSIGYVIAALGILGALAMVVFGWIADRWNAGYICILLCTLTMTVGCAGVAFERGFTSLLLALACIVIGFYGMQGPFWAVPASFLSGTSAASGLALITMIGIFGGFLGPYGLGLGKQLTGDYRGSMLVLAGLSFLSIALIGVLCRSTSSAPSAQP